MTAEQELDLDLELLEGTFPQNESESGIGVYQHPEEEAYETRLEAARKIILRKRDFTSPPSADEFLHQFKDITSKSSIKGAGNLLHVLVGGVQHNDLPPKQVEPLVRRLVDGAPDLLRDKNKEGQTPILMAIRTCQSQLLNYMVSACVEHRDQELSAKSLNEALTMKQEGRTALHVAFTEKLTSETLRMLIQNASDEALGSKDQTGRTPMHDAVQFHKCDNARLDLIDLFIQRDSRSRLNKPKSAETFLDMCDKQHCSVFQEHQKSRVRTCAQYPDRPKAPETTKRDPIDPLRESKKPSVRDPRPHDNSKEPKAIPEARISGEPNAERFNGGGRHLAPSDDHERRRQEMKDLERTKEGISGISTRNDGSSDRDSTVRDTSRYQSSGAKDPDESTRSRDIHSSQQPDLRSNTSAKRSNTFRDEAKQGEGGKPTAKQKPAQDRVRVLAVIAALEKNSDKVLQNLKLYYMRTRNPEMVILFLYGKNMNDIQTAFDYRGLPSQITWKSFAKMFGENNTDGYNFDTVLQYATFPRVKVLATGHEAAIQNRRLNEDNDTKPGAKSRKDLKYFLDWLYTKGVRHIIRLSVEDSGDSGQEVHSDQVIQAALAKFSIEHLDWQKTDLDPETILHIGSEAQSDGQPLPGGLSNTNSASGSQLKKLTLLWSGSNAALRAWGDQEALPMLPWLQEVEIIRPPSHLSYDSQIWIKQKVQAFELRLNKNRPRQEPLSSGTSQGVSIGDAPAFDYIRVKAVDSVANSGLGATSNGAHPIDTSTPDQNQWLHSVEGFARFMTPYWESTVQRFLEERQDQGTSEGVERDVTIALIDDGVDKFDIGRSSQILQGKSFDFHDDRLNPPYLSAKGHGTVMASMILRVCPMAKIYPIRLKTNSDASGNSTIDPEYAARAIQAALDKEATIISMSWTVSMKEGEDGSKEHLHKVLEKAVADKVLMFCCAPDHGNVSAALGAGLAAMIIYCVKAGIMAAKTAKQNEYIPDDSAIQVAKPDAMKKAFGRLGTVTDNKFIQVWERLDKATEILERWEKEKERPNPEALASCIRDFTRFAFKLAD
ncbi:hypothetical protein ACHAPE_006316 [Trichoderma viride]